MSKTQSADAYFAGADRWRNELASLRRLVLDLGLQEAVKWGGPCYTLNGRNVVGIAGFKSYFGLWFFQGALLDDPDGVLVNAQQGKTRAMRQWRMQSARDIRPARVRRYVRAAAALARAGTEISPRRRPALPIPAELTAAFADDPAAGTAFQALTPGRRCEYIEFIAAARRAETRQRRIAKILPLIEAGAGLNDRYRR